jgi:hypothetical protein
VFSARARKTAPEAGALPCTKAAWTVHELHQCGNGDDFAAMSLAVEYLIIS